MVPAYREYEPPAHLDALVACLWENDADEARTQRVVPDGCVDLIWLGPRELVVAGADTGPRHVELPAGARLSGIRLRPGAAGAVLGLPAAAVRDAQLSLASIWGESGLELEDAIDDAEPARRLQLLAAAVARRRAEPDPLVLAAARKLAVASVRVATVADELGVSERQLHRRTLAAVGYGPKMLARVARLRRLVSRSEERLVARALAAGYASQAHMNEEVRRLTGATPVRFLKDAALTAA
jgi:AraC-like DNA-binding protein